MSLGKWSTIKHEVSRGHDKNDKTISVCQGSEVKGSEILRNGILKIFTIKPGNDINEYLHQAEYILSDVKQLLHI